MSTEVQAQDLPVVTNLDRHMSVNEVLTQSLIVHEILTRVMVVDIHYGTLPGCKKPSLYQPGAEKICVTFRLAPKFDVDDLSEPRENFYRYRVKCSLYTIRDGMFVGSAMGEASTAEEKYQWEAALNQKHFDTTDPDKRRIKFKKGKDGAVDEILQVQQNAADLANTILKMACKRGLTSATKGATGASDIFDVDLEEDAVAKLAKEDGKEEKEAPQMKAKPKPAPTLGFGRSKGKALDDPSVPLDDLNWMADFIAKNVGSTRRKAYEKSDRELLALLEAEIQHRTGDTQGMTDKEWVDYCAAILSTQEEAYTQACLDFKTQDPTTLPVEARLRFQDHMKKLTAK